MSVRLSVIVPVKNGASCIAILLDSLRRQQGADAPGYEFIVVDDGSSDDTAAVIAGYDWVKLIRHPAGRGAAAARNSGARAASGEWLLFLDADTRIREADFLPRAESLICELPDCDVISGCYHESNSGASRFARYLDVCESVMRERGLDQPAPGCLSASLCLIKRAVFMAHGGFSEHPSVALEDPELGCRLTAAGHRLWLTGALRVDHRQPDFTGYVRELVPRTRHYLALIRQYRVFNAMMGGGAEGVGRGALVLGALLLGVGMALPVAGLVGAALLVLAGLTSHRLWAELLRRHGPAFVPIGVIFHLGCSLAIVAGGVLAAFDTACYAVRRLRIEMAVVWAYLKSLCAPRTPGYLIHFVTHRCNARCGHCFDGPQRHGIARGAELDLGRIERIATSAGGVGHVSLTGGEPLLREDLAEILVAYYRAGVRSFSVSTNGAYPERLSCLVERLPVIAPRARVMVMVSVDALGDEHDRLRGVPGLFAAVKASIGQLCAARARVPQLRVHVSIAATARNVAGVPELVAWLQGSGLDQIDLTRLRGVPADSSLAGVSADQYARASASVARANGRARGLAGIFALLDRAMYRVVHSPQEPWPCGGCLAGRRLVVLHADGTVLPCEMIRDVRSGARAAYGDFVLGRLDAHRDDLRAALDSADAARIRAYIRTTQCRCSFECAIFATMVYRPWTLPRFAWRGLASAGRAPRVVDSGEKAVDRESEQGCDDPRRDLQRDELGQFLGSEQRAHPAGEQRVFFAPRAATLHVGVQPGRGGNEQHEIV